MEPTPPLSSSSSSAAAAAAPSREELMAHAHDFTTVTLVVKHGKDRIVLDGLPPSTSVLQVKEMIQQQTRILPKRQKLVGLVARTGGARGVTDDLPLGDLHVKKGGGRPQHDAADRIVEHSCILMGTPEEMIFVDPGDRDDLPDVIDDFELDFTAGSDEWMQHVANEANLRDFTERTAVHVMNPPRDGKPLLVLDLDHTLMDFSSQRLQQQQQPPPLAAAAVPAVPAAPLHEQHDAAAAMKRPFMNEFLTTCYRHYDLVVWSQTSWRWLETKLTELGMITHPGYKFSFVLDKTSMFKVTSTKRDGTSVTHSVKPLQLIWTKFPRWGPHNTVHVDDLSRNFALNLNSGLKVTAYFRKKSMARRDSELLALARYLEDLALSGAAFDLVDFAAWPDVVSGKRRLLREDSNGKSR